MAGLGIADIVSPSFACEGKLNGDHVTIRFSGTGDMGAVGRLTAYLRALQVEVKRLQIGVVEFDLSALYLLNSSCLTNFINFVTATSSYEPAPKIIFTTNRHLPWQSKSLAIVERMARVSVSVR